MTTTTEAATHKVRLREMKRQAQATESQEYRGDALGWLLQALAVQPTRSVMADRHLSILRNCRAALHRASGLSTVVAHADRRIEVGERIAALDWALGKVDERLAA